MSQIESFPVTDQENFLVTDGELQGPLYNSPFYFIWLKYL